MRAGRERTRQYGTGLLLAALGLWIGACAFPPKGRADLDLGLKERGVASWYGHYFHGLVTASGEPYDMEAFTAAHRTLRLGTVVRVLNVLNGAQVWVRINDRGPYVNGRVLDLSLAAARRLGMVEQGIAAVQLEVIGHQRDGLLFPYHQVVLAWWSLAQSSPVPSATLAGPIRPGEQSLIHRDGRDTRGFRLPPGDLLRSRRARRVADILAAEHRVYAVATRQIP